MRSNFNKRTQGENKSAESFITAVLKLAETCAYSDLQEQLICDRIIAGIRDQKFQFNSIYSQYKLCR